LFPTWSQFIQLLTPTSKNMEAFEAFLSQYFDLESFTFRGDKAAAARFYFEHREAIEAFIQTQHAALDHVLELLRTAFGKDILNYKHSGGNAEGFGATVDPTGRIYYHVEVPPLLAVKPLLKVRVELSSAVQPFKQQLLETIEDQIEQPHLYLVEPLEGPEKRQLLRARFPVTQEMLLPGKEFVYFTKLKFEEKLAPLMDQIVEQATKLIYKDVGLDWEERSDE
ncbi:MAG: hypothetical protein AAFR59_10650, partial [Bacteroidota bacterium]